MNEHQEIAYNEYLEITGEKNKRQKSKKQINIRLTDSDYEKLDKLAEISKESLKLSFTIGSDTVNLNEVVPTSWQKITPTVIASHLVRKAINELLPDN